MKRAVAERAQAGHEVLVVDSDLDPGHAIA
jgi:hypothetical protein